MAAKGVARPPTVEDKGEPLTVTALKGTEVPDNEIQSMMH